MNDKMSDKSVRQKCPTASTCEKEKNVLLEKVFPVLEAEERYRVSHHPGWKQESFIAIVYAVNTEGMVDRNKITNI
jgi:hypothetical protein